MTTFYLNPYALISFSSFLVMMLLGFILWMKYYSPQTKFILFLFLANAIYSLFYSFEISFKTIEEITWFYRFEYFGISFLSAFYLMFALHFSGRSKWLTLRNKFFLLIIPITTLILVFTNESHHLFYTEGKMNDLGPFPSFAFKPSFWYFVQQTYVILTMTLSLFFLGNMLKRTALIYRRQLILMLLATLFPFLGYLAYQLRLVPFGIDPVSFTFTLSGIVIYLALARFKLFDLMPIARSKLFEMIQDGVFVFDLTDRLVDFNQMACKQLKINKKDLGKSVHELLEPWPEILQFVAYYNSGKLEIKLLDDGNTFYYKINLLVLENGNDIKQGKLVVINDITDLVNTEKARNYTASKLDAVIAAMPDMMFVIDRSGVITDFFASDTEQLFLNKDEVLGASLKQLFNEEEANELMQILNNSLHSEKLSTYQHEMNFSGVLKHYEVRISGMDEEHVLVIERNVTESYEMRQSLIYQSGFQEILMQLASRFIYITESDTDFVISDSLRQIGEYIEVDRCYIFRYDFENVSMTNTHEWCRQGILPLIKSRQMLALHVMADWSSLHQRGETTFVENPKKLNPTDPVRQLMESIDIQSIITIPMLSQKNCLGFVGFESKKDNRKWFDSEVSLLKIFTGMLANLQEKITIEQALVEARIKAEASNRLKTAFMNNISHEIRTPLNGIIGFGEIIANEELTLVEKNKFLTVVQESSERLIHTIDDYIDISMLVTGNQEANRKNFLILNLIEEVVEEFSEMGSLKNIAISATIPQELKHQTIFSDYDLIHKVFNHLMGNSLKFTEKGSIRIGVTREINNLIFYVEDSGIGIADNVQNYVFDSFMQEDFSSTRMYEGSGLGLSIVKGIVTLLGGQITLSSAKGIGTTIYFSIPIGSTKGM